MDTCKDKCDKAFQDCKSACKDDRKCTRKSCKRGAEGKKMCKKTCDSERCTNAAAALGFIADYGGVLQLE